MSPVIHGPCEHRPHARSSTHIRTHTYTYTCVYRDTCAEKSIHSGAQSNFRSPAYVHHVLSFSDHFCHLYTCAPLSACFFTVSHSILFLFLCFCLSLVILVLSVTDKYSFRFFLASGRMRQIKLDLFYDLFCSIIFSFWFSILVGLDRIPNVRYISYILLISNRDILSIYFNKLQHNYYYRIFSNIPLEEIRKLTETFRLSAIR